MIASLLLIVACGDEPQSRPTGGWAAAVKVVTQLIDKPSPAPKNRRVTETCSGAARCVQ